MVTDQAYSRWATGGKPVIWAEAGYLYNENPPNQPQPQTQADYYSQFINSMWQTNGSGVQFWWWPGGLRTTEPGLSKDFGVINPDGTLRPAATVMANLAGQATSPRPVPRQTVTGTPVDLIADARGYAWTYYTHQLEALAAVTAIPSKGYVLNGKGAGTYSASTTWVGGLPEYLWAEISKVELRVGQTGSWFEVRNGMAYAVPPRQKIYCRAEVVNMGDATCLTNVAFAANPRQAGFLNFAPQSLAANAPRLTKAVIPEFQLTAGLTADHPVQFQMNAQGVCWITGSVQIHLAVDKPDFNRAIIIDIHGATISSDVGFLLFRMIPFCGRLLMRLYLVLVACVIGWDLYPNLPIFGVSPAEAAQLQQDFNQPLVVHNSQNVSVSGNLIVPKRSKMVLVLLFLLNS